MKHQYADDPDLDADFQDTRPPPTADARLAGLMRSLGAVTIRAVIFDLDTRLCHESWQIDEHGESVDDGSLDGAINQFVTAMGTIAQLSQTPAGEILIRQLNPRRCAFAWRIDARSVVVAEARYRLPQSGPRDLDGALLRDLFIAHRRRKTGAPALAAVDVHVDPAEPAPGHDGAMVHLDPAAGEPGPAAWLDDESRPQAGAGAGAVSLAGSTAGPGSLAAPGPARVGTVLLTLVLACLLAATLFFIADRETQQMRADQWRLQERAEATMSRKLTDVLAQGDYGEVQFELETFAELGYFQTALVTNAQQRVIALVGTVAEARIGNVYAAETDSAARVVTLLAQDPPVLGQLMTWPAAGAAAAAPASSRNLLAAAVLLCLVGLAGTFWLLLQRSRGPQLRAQAGSADANNLTRRYSPPARHCSR